MSGNKKRLGKFFQSYEPPEDEKKRIAEIANNGGIPALIITKYAPETDPYRDRFIKEEQIPGFSRPGKGAWHKQATQRIIHYLKDSESWNTQFIWMLYQHSATQWVIKELPALNKLLSQVEPPADDDPAEHLRAICSNAMEFGVTQDDVRKFYEAWWIPRTDRFEELLSLCLVNDEARVQSRKLALLSTAIEEVKKSVIELSATATSHSAANDSLKTLLENESTRIDNFESSMKHLRKALQTTNDAITSAVSPKIRPLENSITNINAQLKKLEQLIKSSTSDGPTKVDLKKVADSLRADVVKSTAAARADLANGITASQEALAKSLKENLATGIAEFESKLTGAFKEIGKKRETAATQAPLPTQVYVSPLSPFLSRAPLHPKLTSELDLVNSWITQLSRAEGITLSLEQAIAYHSMFLASYAVICEHRLVQLWIDCLGWQQHVMHLVASPVWSTEEDWAAGAEFLFKEKASRAPRILVIHNYDVGLPDCYLAPSLRLWSLHEEPKGLAKIFLIPTRHADQISAQILEDAGYIPESDYSSARSLALNDRIKLPHALGHDIPTGVDPKTALEWISAIPKLDYDFGVIRKSMDLAVHSRIKSAILKTAAAASRYLNEPCSIGAGMNHHLLPWVRAKHGESAYSELGAFLKQLPDVRY